MRFVPPACAACLCLAGCLLAVSGCELKTPADHQQNADVDSLYETDVPYVPTPDPVVERMLEMADVSEGDVVYDLGSGDGRIVRMAVQTYDVKRAVGVELVPELVDKSRSYARLAGITDRTTFHQADLFDIDLYDATVVTMYLYDSVIRKLKPRLLRQLDPGDRVVSHEYTGDDDRWPPDTTVVLGEHAIHLWTVPDDIPEWAAADSLASE